MSELEGTSESNSPDPHLRRNSKDRRSEVLLSSVALFMADLELELFFLFKVKSYKRLIMNCNNLPPVLTSPSVIPHWQLYCQLSNCSFCHLPSYLKKLYCYFIILDIINLFIVVENWLSYIRHTFFPILSKKLYHNF